MDIVPIYFQHFKKNVNEPFVILRGSSRSAKTYSVCQWFYYLSLSGVKYELTIVGKSIPFIRDGVYNSFKQIAPGEMFIKNPFFVQINNSTILFRSFKDEDDAKSAERDFLYVNECNDVDYSIIQQLVIRTRIQCYFDFNPTKKFWIDQYVNDRNMLHTTFKDNPFLSQAQLDNFERIRERAARLNASAFDKYLYSVYYLGEYGDMAGNVFSQIEEINDEQYLEVVGKKRLWCLDFGFSQDPCALVELTYNKEIDKYIASQKLYQNGLNDFKLAEIIKSHAEDDEVIVCDWGAGGDARISNLFELTGLSFARAVKGDGSIKNGVELINSKHFLLHGEDINREFKGYEFKDGAFVDKDNHCFVGETLITTINGQKRIDQIKVGDLVLTSKGFKPVLKVFNNGLKQVNNYSIKVDTLIVNLCSTNNHKIKTTNEWTEISKLESGQMVYLCKSSTTKNFIYTLMKGIFQKAISECTSLFTSLTMAKSKRGFTFTTKTATRGIIKSTISKLSKKQNICANTENKDLNLTKIGLKIFTPKELNPQKNGINQKTVANGTLNTQNKTTLIERIKNIIVNNAAKNTKQSTLELQNFVIKTAKLKHLGKDESYNAIVFDLMVEDCHEYFANGILVHNCIDSSRYGLDYAMRSHYFDS